MEGTFTGVRTSAIGVPLDKRRVPGASFTLKRVCSTCNNGWMSQMEVHFAEVFSKLETGLPPSRLSRKERHTISMWTIKTGVVAHLSANYRRILPDDFPAKLQNGRAIPGGVKVFCAGASASQEILWSQGNLLGATIRKTDAEVFDSKQHTYAFFIAIRGLVLGFAWHGLDNRHYKLQAVHSDIQQIHPKPTSSPRRRLLQHIHEGTMSVLLVPR